MLENKIQYFHIADFYFGEVSVVSISLLVSKSFILLLSFEVVNVILFRL